MRHFASWLVPALAVGWLTSCAPRPTPVTSVTIVADPGPFPSVERAATSPAEVNWWDADSRDDDASTVGFAAAELHRWLPSCLGLPPETTRLSATLPDTGDVIVVGIGGDRRVDSLLSLAARASRSPDVAAAGGFRIRAFEGGGRRVVVVAGDDRAGALYGAYALLDRLGTRFVGLGDTGVVTPSRPAPWPRGLSVGERPAFAVRGFWAWEPRGSRDFFLWMARNRINQWTTADTAYVPIMKQLGFRLTGGGHSIQSEFLTPARYFASHPEWYGLHGGRRSPAIRGESGDNFCTSNGEARRQLARNLVDALADGSLRHVDWLELWMLDGGRWCECDACRAEGNPSDRVLDVAHEVTKAVAEARRDGRIRRPVEVSALAYLETMEAPSRRDHGPGSVAITFFPYFRCYAHSLFDSTCTEINRRIASAYRGWDDIAARWGVCEYYDVGAFKTLPLVYPHVMAADLGRYAQHPGVERFEYMHAPTRAWGCWALDHWLIARLAWNPRQNVDSLVARFCRDAFPSSAAEMVEHYRHLEVASANILALQHCVGVFGTSAGEGGRLAQPSLPLFPLRHFQPSESHPPTDDAPDLDQIERAMGEARQALDRARSADSGPIERARLAEEERRFAYGEAMLAFYAALIRTAEHHRAGDAAGARAAFTAAKAAARELRAVTDLVQVSASHANARDGLEASGVSGTYEYFRRRYGR